MSQRDLNPSKDIIDKDLETYFAGESEQSVIADLLDDDKVKLLYAIWQEVKDDGGSSPTPSEPSQKGTYEAEMDVTITSENWGTHDNDRERYDFGFVASVVDVWFDNPLDIRWNDSGGRNRTSYPPSSTPTAIKPFNSRYMWVRKPQGGSDVTFSYVAHD